MNDTMKDIKIQNVVVQLKVLCSPETCKASLIKPYGKKYHCAMVAQDIQWIDYKRLEK